MLRLRLLFLLPHVPGLEAANGGARSTAHLIRSLSDRHEVAVLCLRRGDDAAADDELRRSCSLYEEIPQATATSSDVSCIQRLRRWALPLVRTPGWALATNVPAFRRRLRSIMPEWRPDVVHIAYHVMGQYADELRSSGAHLVLTQYEPGVTAANDARRRARGLDRVRAALEHAVWARYERHVMAQMDAIVVFTEEDQRILEPLAGGKPITHIPLGTPIPETPLDPAGREGRVLFVGNFSHPPNIDAAVRLMRSIFPAVQRECPDARLTIVGPKPTEEITSLAGGLVTVTGAVDSVVPFLDDASVVVAPLREGGGMRVKVLEALAAGKAVVASPLATTGIQVTSGRQLMIADSDPEFAAAIIELLQNTDERVALARSGRDWACSHLGWDRPAAQYERLQWELTHRAEPGQLGLAPDRAIPLETQE